MMIYLAFFLFGHIESPIFLEVYSKGGGEHVDASNVKCNGCSSIN